MYSGVRQYVKESAPASSPITIGGGWREDKESGSKDEFVFFGGWNDVEEQRAFAQRCPAYMNITGLADESGIKHYRRIQ